MALNKAVLKKSLKDMFASRPKSEDEAAEKLAGIIFDFVTSADVTTTVTGTCTTPAGEGSINGAGSGSLS
jgi:hypothetical protein